MDCNIRLIQRKFELVSLQCNKYTNILTFTKMEKSSSTNCNKHINKNVYVIHTLKFFVCLLMVIPVVLCDCVNFIA